MHIRWVAFQSLIATATCVWVMLSIGTRMRSQICWNLAQTNKSNNEKAAQTSPHPHRRIHRRELWSECVIETKVSEGVETVRA